MAESYKLGNKTAELLARVIVLREIQQTGKLDMHLRYGRKGKLQESLECSPMTLNRSLAALETVQPEVDRLWAKINLPDGGSIAERVKVLLALSEKRYAEMKQNPVTSAIAYEDYYELLQAEGVIA